MRAVRLEAVGRLALRDVPEPVPGPGEVLVRVEACGICGTDRHLLHGEFPSAPPVTLGHEVSGLVEAVGEGVTLRPGTRVTLDPNIACGRCEPCRRGRVNLCERLQAIGIHRDGGFAERVLAPEGQAYPLPGTLDPLHGAFCEPLACCLHGMDLAGVRPGASVAVLGGGVIGLLVVQLARLAGAGRIVLSTRQAPRRALAERLGATATIDPSEGDVVSRLLGPGGSLPGGADVVVECAGVADTVAQSLRLARPGGTVVILGVMPKGERVAVEPFDLLFRELTVFGSFLNPFAHGRAAALVASGALELDALATRRIGLEEVPAVVAARPGPGEVKTLIVPS